MGVRALWEFTESGPYGSLLSQGPMGVRALWEFTESGSYGSQGPMGVY